MSSFRKKGVDYTPAGDGVTHINVYSMGNTECGRKLSNFQRIDITTSLGYFASTEALYFYIKIYLAYKYANSEMPNRVANGLEAIRHLHGVAAQRKGRDLRRVVKSLGVRVANEPSAEMEDLFCEGLREKFLNDPDLLAISNDYFSEGIPFLHYYVYEGSVMSKPHFDWLPKMLDRTLEAM